MPLWPVYGSPVSSSFDQHSTCIRLHRLHSTCAFDTTNLNCVRLRPGVHEAARLRVCAL